MSSFKLSQERLDPFRMQWQGTHIGWRLEGVTHCVGNCTAAACYSTLASSPCMQRIAGCRCIFKQMYADFRKIAGPWPGVLAECDRLWLSPFVILEFFKERTSNALRRTSKNLATGQHWVNSPTNFVCDSVTQQMNLPCLTIDFNLSVMYSVWITHLREDIGASPNESR